VLIGTSRYEALARLPSVEENLVALAEALSADRVWGPPDVLFGLLWNEPDNGEDDQVTGEMRQVWEALGTDTDALGHDLSPAPMTCRG
jgi:hypothetical protein